MENRGTQQVVVVGDNLIELLQQQREIRDRTLKRRRGKKVEPGQWVGSTNVQDKGTATTDIQQPLTSVIEISQNLNKPSASGNLKQNCGKKQRKCGICRTEWANYRGHND